MLVYQRVAEINHQLGLLPLPPDQMVTEVMTGQSRRSAGDLRCHTWDQRIWSRSCSWFPSNLKKLQVDFRFFSGKKNTQKGGNSQVSDGTVFRENSKISWSFCRNTLW